MTPAKPKRRRPAPKSADTKRMDWMSKNPGKVVAAGSEGWFGYSSLHKEITVAFATSSTR